MAARLAMSHLGGDTDESRLAGLLLLSRCTRPVLTSVASDAVELLTEPEHTCFLVRLLATKPTGSETAGAGAGTGSGGGAALLSPMQTLALHVSVSLADCGSDAAKARLLKVVTPRLAALLASTSSEAFKVGIMWVFGWDLVVRVRVRVRVSVRVRVGFRDGLCRR